MTPMSTRLDRQGNTKKKKTRAVNQVYVLMFPTPDKLPTLSFLLKRRDSWLKLKLDYDEWKKNHFLHYAENDWRSWRPQNVATHQRGKPPTNQSRWVQKWFHVGEGGEGHDCFAHHYTATWVYGWKDKKKMDEKIFGPAAPVREGRLWVSHPNTATLGSLIFLDAVVVSDFFFGGCMFAKHTRFPEQQLSLALMDLACLHPLAFLITLSRDLVSPTIRLMNLAI